MTSFLNKLKSLAIGVMVFSFFLAVTLSSCTSKDKGSENKENVDDAASQSEEPAAQGEEHPEDSEEHPADSTATASGSEEHPADSAEHPNEEE